MSGAPRASAPRAGRIRIAIALLLVLCLAVVAACAGRPSTSAMVQSQQARKNEVTALWTQIREWRREAGMGVDPSPAMVFTMSRESVYSVERSCPSSHSAPATCGDICSLADAICDNAESICSIAAELGDDPWAKGKCDNAKASCKEARQRCCDCSGKP